ncbi:uncharacterized protein LOC103843895 [Brassica rapa]|uniref:uncharacterized protein LOC103843895 n=1 Tax=Brassica campestris TaxID=3711 RepID=UPI0004F177AD|nr:uncharacterized protein LOC103843895 [Brassica rapa]
MHAAANKQRRDVQFDVGDWVYLKLRPYRKNTVAMRKVEKLAPRFFGPYFVIQRVGKVAYKLALPDQSQIHPVFHVSQLQLGVEPQDKVHELPLILSSSFEWNTEPEELLEIRQSSLNKQAEVLVKWKGLPEFESTWESVKTLAEQYPEFQLEDKLTSAYHQALCFDQSKLRGLRTAGWASRLMDRAVGFIWSGRRELYGLKASSLGRGR